MKSGLDILRNLLVHSVDFLDKKVSAKNSVIYAFFKKGLLQNINSLFLEHERRKDLGEFSRFLDFPDFPRSLELDDFFRCKTVDK